MTHAEFNAWLEDPRRRPLVMGVLNVTPDSFSDGGRFVDVEAAVAQAAQMAADGADVIDIGGESTRPGSHRVDAAEQIRRVLPVFSQLAGRLAAVLSVDTTRAEVARAAVDCGAAIINDISAGQEDPAMIPLAAQRGAAMILMHMKGQPATMQAEPVYQDVLAEVMAFLAARLWAAESGGIAPHRLMIDPGIGFGKTVEHNLQLLQQLSRLGELGRPVVVGTSRKAFIGRVTNEPAPDQRLFGTAATVAWSVTNGSAMVRVHDVKAMAQVVRMVRAIQMGRAP